MGIFHSLQKITITEQEFYNHFDGDRDGIVTWEEFDCIRNGLGCQGLGYGYA